MTVLETSKSAGGVDRRHDPSRDRRRVILYTVGLIAFYVGAIIAFHPAIGDRHVLEGGLSYAVMLAPTAGALLAVVAGPGVIRFGRPTWWILAGFLPSVVAFGASLLASALGWVELRADRLPALLAFAVLLSLYGCIAAIGEEIGWRGFLWPLLRRRYTFATSAAIMFVAWWLYHAPLVLLGWYGFQSGLPAFTIGLAGSVLFVGVLTDRSRSIWPSVLAHGSWNGLVAAYFSTTGAVADGVFGGSRTLLGEFGWLATGGMLLLGVVSAVWHVRAARRHRPVNSSAL
jgi:membrane protease YdiL (CAAX protease family)